MKKRELQGLRFGRLTVQSLHSGTHSGRRWSCLCDCGTASVVFSHELLSGRTRSCGCLRKERATAANTRHGHGGRKTRTSTYGVWYAMKQRCTNPKFKQYKDYGGRGIRVCTRWAESFEAFLKDMGERPVDLTIERENNDGNYEPDNCRWATRKEQQQNTRRSRA